MNPVSKWLGLVIGLALFGYAIFAFEYSSIANRYRELTQSNTTYIELERLVRDVFAKSQICIACRRAGSDLAGGDGQIVGR